MPQRSSSQLSTFWGFKEDMLTMYQEIKSYLLEPINRSVAQEVRHTVGVKKKKEEEWEGRKIEEKGEEKTKGKFW